MLVTYCFQQFSFASVCRIDENNESSIKLWKSEQLQNQLLVTTYVTFMYSYNKTDDNYLLKLF